MLILSATRTPLGRFGGALQRREAVHLAACAMTAALAGLPPGLVQEVILGHTHGAGSGPSPALRAARAAGLEVPASSHAAGGASALALLGHLQQATLLASVGALSQAPYLLPEARWGRRLGAGQALDILVQDGLDTPLADPELAARLEALARNRGIAHDACLDWARGSRVRALKAPLRGLVPVDTGRRRGLLRLESDEPPHFPEAPIAPLADGAAALLLAPEGPGLARIRGFARAMDASGTGLLGAVPALQAALTAAHLSLGDLAQVELEETSAVQVLACLQDLPGLDPNRVNPAGGALALGHPGGAAGLRLAVDLVHRLAPGTCGALALSAPDGQGTALILERLP